MTTPIPLTPSPEAKIQEAELRRACARYRADAAYAATRRAALSPRPETLCDVLWGLWDGICALRPLLALLAWVVAAYLLLIVGGSHLCVWLHSVLVGGKI